ncbi:LysR family transcriptional regulator [Streptomyces sp. NPDC097704]|uniref:LysR family transcriptional regulator n=1 Tax=Streptomyces sp. NPDC097704 TaxID=3157101 RepID=UPI00333276E0
MHIAQPSFSRQLSALEKDLGASLFTRRPGSPTLNAAGRRFRPSPRTWCAAPSRPPRRWPPSAATSPWHSRGWRLPPRPRTCSHPS